MKAFCCSRRQIFKKLVTKEDPIYLHKTLGICAILSFVYRYGWVYSNTGTLGFNGHWFDHLNLALHLALSCSSMIFEVLMKRILSKPLIIWHEYRLHTIVFTLRSVSVYLYSLCNFEDTTLNRFCLLFGFLAHHLVVDEITRRHGPED